MTKPLEALINRAKHIVENGGLLARDTSLALIAALEQSQQRVYELENDEVRQRLANAEHQLHVAGLANHNLRASRRAQFHKRRSAEKRIAELEASQLAVKLPGEFAVIGENLRTQDNRITSDPMFCIYQKEEIVVDDEYDHDRIVWWNNEHCHEASKLRAKRLELLHHDGRDTPEEWRRIAVKEINDFVTCCLTEQGCKDYLAINGHNLRKPFIYVKSGFRNNEYQTIRNWLMLAGGTVQGDE